MRKNSFPPKCHRKMHKTPQNFTEAREKRGATKFIPAEMSPQNAQKTRKPKKSWKNGFFDLLLSYQGLTERCKPSDPR